MMTLEIYSEHRKRETIEVLIKNTMKALNDGVDVKANLSKKYLAKDRKQLIVPIHLIDYEEDKLGLKHVAEYI